MCACGSIENATVPLFSGLITLITNVPTTSIIFAGPFRMPEKHEA